MTVITSTNNTPWIVSPSRQKLGGGQAKQWIEKTAKALNCSFVLLDGEQVAFSSEEGNDFAKLLAKQYKNLLYIDHYQDRYIFIHIKAGDIQLDRVLLSFDKVAQQLKFIERTLKNSAYKVITCNIDGLNQLIGKIKEANDRLSVQSSDTSFINSLVPSNSELDKFISIEFAVRSLTDTKTQKVTIIGVLLLISFIFAYQHDFFFFKEKEEMIKLDNPYKTTNQIMLQYSPFSSRLLQDFRIHSLMKKNLPNWQVYNVVYVEDAIVYQLMKKSYLSRISKLNEFAERYGMAVDTSNKNISLIAGVIKQPIYKAENDIMAFNIDKLTANIIDNTIKNTPFVNISVVKTIKPPEQAWTERDLSIELENASVHDLLRLAAIVDGKKKPYPTFYKACSNSECSYSVTPGGVIKGIIDFKIYGEK